MGIYRIAMSNVKSGKITGYKLVSGKSIGSVLNAPKAKYVGRGVRIVGVMPTRITGSLKARASMPRSRRFGTVSDTLYVKKLGKVM